MAREEGSQGFCHAAGIVHVQQVRCLGQFEGLGVWQPGEQQFPSLAEDRMGSVPEDNEGRVGDAARIFVREFPLLHRGQFVAALRDTRSVLPAIPTVVPELPEAQSYLSLPGWRHLCIPVFSADCVPLGFGR